MNYFSTSSGRIELALPLDLAHVGYHSGACDSDIDYLKTIPEIEQQLSKLSPALLRDELKEYGAWDEIELADHGANLGRILWLACGDVVDQAEE